MLILESLLEKQEVIGTHQGTNTLAAAILGSSSYHEDAGAGKHHFGVLTLDSKYKDLAPHTSW